MSRASRLLLAALPRWLSIMMAEARTVMIIMSAPMAAKLEWRNSIMTVMEQPAPSSGRIRSAAAPAPSLPSARVGGFSREISGSGRNAGVVLAGRWTIRMLIGSPVRRVHRCRGQFSEDDLRVLGSQPQVQGGSTRDVTVVGKHERGDTGSPEVLRVARHLVTG